MNRVVAVKNSADAGFQLEFVALLIVSGNALHHL